MTPYEELIQEHGDWAVRRHVYRMKAHLGRIHDMAQMFVVVRDIEGMPVQLSMGLDYES